MNELCIFTVFDKDKPRTTGIKYKDKIKYFDLYRDNSFKPIKKIKKRLETIQEIILNYTNNHKDVVLNDAKSHYNVIPDIESTYRYIYEVPNVKFDSDGSFESDCIAIENILNRFSETQMLPYNKLLANAARIYRRFELNGVLSHYSKINSKWLTTTFTGRSKCTGFNVQGAVAEDNIRSINALESDLIVTFDWIAADFRIASLLSGDKVLQEAYMVSDPYTYLMDILNEGNAENKLNRDEVKLFMLSSINGYSDDNQVFDVYKNLGRWVHKMWKSINNGDDVESILGRKFLASEAKNKKSLMNAVMQGSVAHAMHAVLPKLYDAFGDDLITEIHDSIPIMVRNNSNSVKNVINEAKKIIMYPFEGILDDNPVFPIKVSIGKWKKWKAYKVYRG